MNPWQQNRKIVWGALLLLGILTAALRLHSLQEPLHTDLTVYAYIGNQMLSGEKLYSELVDNKPPGIYLVNLLAVGLGGYRAASICWLGVAAALLTQLFIFLLLRRLAGAGPALWGAAAWTLFSSSFHLLANQPNTEAFINVFLTLAFWLLIRALQSRPQELWLSGLAFGLASFFKTNVFFLFALVSLWLLAFLWKQSGGKGKYLARMLAQFLTPPAVFWACVFSYFAATGRWDEFTDVVFKALSIYAGNIPVNEWRFFTVPGIHLGFLQHETIVLAVFFILWLGLACFRPKTPWDGLLMAYVLGGMLMVGSLAGHFTVYYQIFMPLLTVFFALALHELRVRLAPHSRLSRGAAALVGLAGLGALSAYAGQYLATSPEDLSRRKFGEGLVAEQKLGRLLEVLTQPEDTIYQWGTAGHLYFFSRRRAASGVVQNHILFFSPEDVQDKVKNKIFSAVFNARPAFIVFSGWIGDFQESMIFQTLHSQYRYFGAFDKMLIFVRDDHRYDLRTAANLIKTMDAQDERNLYGRLFLAGRTRTPEFYAEAQREANRKLADRPGEDRYARLLREGNQSAGQGEWAGAMKAWVEAERIASGRPESAANLGVYHENLGAYFLALDHYQIAFHHLGPPWDAYYRQVQRKLILQVQAAEDRLARPPEFRRNLILAEGRDEYADWVRRGNEEAGKYRWPEARDLWLAATRKHPERPEAWANLGIAYEIARQYDSAVSAYERAAAVLGEPWRTYLNETRAYLGQPPEKSQPPAGK